jgi:stage II sporulation protein D
VSAVPLEDLVARAVAGEGGDALPRAALEALAVTVRTFAVRNRGRHAAEGFDLCDLTHCMALRPATARTRAAAVATSGQVLVADGRTAEVYFSASCGGHTERPSAVWTGAEDPTHLVAKADEVCAHESPWVTEVGEPQLRRVLQAAGLRGTLVEILQVESRTTSGRAAVLTVRGMTPGRLDANVFRMTAGRLLGWNVVKSTRFDIARTGTGYRFTGRGLGHGVGLCVRGAGTRAATGSPALEILAWYFPGTNVAPLASGEADVHLVLLESERHQGTSVRAMIADSLRSLSATLDVPVPGRVDVVFHPTVEAYTRATGLPWWTSGRTRGTRIDLLPLSVLQRRGIVETTVRHELVHVLTDAVLADHPLWVREGLARTMAGEQAGAEPSSRPARPCPSDADLRNPASAEAWRVAYDAAAACVARALAAGVAWRDLR